MHIEDYTNLPCSIPAIKVSEYVTQILDEAELDSKEVTFAKLNELSDRQWHTYQLNTESCREAVQSWIASNITRSDKEQVSSALVIAYCFGLDSSFYESLLPHCLEEDINEFKEELKHTIDGKIDPYWSMRSTNLDQKTDSFVPTQ